MIDSAAYAGTEIIRRTIGIALAKEVSIMDEKGNNIAFRKNLLIIGIDLITNSEKYGSCENFIKRIKKLHVNWFVKNILFKKRAGEKISVK